MKTALWILGGLLTGDALFVAYFWILRADYYFPERYEDAFSATAYALLFGLPVLVAFLAVLVAYSMRRPVAGDEVASAPSADQIFRQNLD